MVQWARGEGACGHMQGLCGAAAMRSSRGSLPPHPPSLADLEALQSSLPRHRHHSLHHRRHRRSLRLRRLHLPGCDASHQHRTRSAWGKRATACHSSLCKRTHIAPAISMSMHCLALAACRATTVAHGAHMHCALMSTSPIPPMSTAHAGERVHIPCSCRALRSALWCPHVPYRSPPPPPP